MSYWIRVNASKLFNESKIFYACQHHVFQVSLSINKNYYPYTPWSSIEDGMKFIREVTSQQPCNVEVKALRDAIQDISAIGESITVSVIDENDVVCGAFTYVPNPPSTQG